MNKIYAILALVLVVASAGCIGNNSSTDKTTETNNTDTTRGSGTLAVAMKDKPIAGVGEVTQVNLTIRSIQVHSSSETNASLNESDNNVENSNWISVFSGSKVINLLEYTGNASALFGGKELAAGNYQQIRLYVDSATITTVNNTTNETRTHTLTIPSNVIKIVRGFNVEENETTLITIDWDLDESIKTEGNGSYRLRPTLKILEENDVDLSTKAEVKIGSDVSAQLDAKVKTKLGL